jgi:CubicO group peptidase (beta-lactamase class C family)
MTTLTEVVEGAVGGYRAPGAVVVVQQSGEQCETACANADPSQLFEIGSITKTMTALLVLQHVQTGDIELEDPIGVHLPEFQIAVKEATQHITIRQLLTHTSGLDCGDDFTDTGNGDDCLERYVTEVLSGIGLLHDPGARWSYCNGGYSVLGRLVEVLDGRPWDDALIQRVFEPLGLSATTTARLGSGRVLTTGHRYDPIAGAVVEEAGRMPRSAGAAGNVVASASDLVAFSEALLSGSGQLLHPDPVTEMLTPQYPIREGSQGLAWLVPMAHVALHGGTTRGSSAMLAAIAGYGSMCVLADGPGAGALAWAVRAHLFGTSGRAEPTAGNLAHVEPGACVGRFCRRHVQIAFSLQDGALVATSSFSGPAAQLFPNPEPVVLEPLGGGRFRSSRPYEDGFTLWDFDDLDDSGSPSSLLTGRISNRASED